MRVKMGSDEEWKKAAMNDDTMVAEVLLQLHRQTPSKPSLPKPIVPLKWSVRQRRSKTVSVPRASPTTPLSLSGATSASGGGGGNGSGSGSGSGGVMINGCSEESSKLLPPPPRHLKREETTGSKVTGEASSSRKSRKRTLLELQVEEYELLKERSQLKKEVSLLRVNVEKERALNESLERALNESLKRMKLDPEPELESQRGTTVEARSGDSSDPPAPIYPTVDPAPAASLHVAPPESSGEGHKKVAKYKLPDLNLPYEDDCSSEM